jgi:GNAT superfamily N-acetyltransferase
MTDAVLSIRMLAPSDWEVLRETRLRAMADSPCAFIPGLPPEATWGEREWRQRCGAGTWAVAVERDSVIGLAGLVRSSPPERPHVEWMWVDPDHRHRGVSRSLIDTMAHLGRRAGLSHLFLWVVEGNHDALRAFSRLGFLPTGERQPIDPAGRRYELRLVRPV